MSVLLKKQVFEGVTPQELVQQLEAKKKCKNKLPTWFRSPKIYYPKKLQIEQTSSEITARYKAEIIAGKSLVDLSGGFGVDSYFFSKKMDRVFHCEIDSELSEIAAHNFKILGANNIQSHPKNGIDFLCTSKANFDWIYSDPSRRNDRKGKVFLLSDCLPNIPENLPLIFEKTSHVLLKTSPLLDFSVGLKELKNVKEIHVVSVNNEVKELLWVVEKEYLGGITVNTINFRKNSTEKFSFLRIDEQEATVQYSMPLDYLYEPNAAILKSGAFKTIANQFSLKKLHEHSHLYTAETLLNFPGRRFRIEAVYPFHKKNIRKSGISKANITTRNFPESVSTLRKKLKIGDGGEVYLFFTKDMHQNHIVIKSAKAP
ncbi:THUMP-like domain-containing protein [Spongiimicrobium salis]|uniref:THUMP-like domain-containing protein n=1 Tax=Spongiimicrobium salis TaxID=1667022 RepID=UPI00374D0576